MNKKSNIEETNFTHSRRIKAPTWYYNFAEKHSTSAKILEDSKVAHIDEISTLLWGLSVELILKAIICSKTQKAPKFTHNLNELASTADVLLTNDEKQICLMLTGYIEFAGKYPSGKDAKTMNHFNRVMSINNYEFEGSGILSVRRPKTTGKSRLTRENIEDLYERLHFIYFELNGYIKI